MKLSTLHTLPAALLTEKERKRKKRGMKFRKGEKPGMKKHEGTPFAKAIKDIAPDQEKIADRTDVHPSTVSRWKSGIRKPQFDNLKKVSKSTGKRAEILFPSLKS